MKCKIKEKMVVFQLKTSMGENQNARSVYTERAFLNNFLSF